VLGLVTSLLMRGLLDPAQMGIWQAWKMFLSYGNYFNLGISKGAAREWSVALGRGETQTAARGLNLAFTVNTLTSLAYGVALAAAGIWIGWTSDGPWAVTWSAGLVALALVVVLQRHVTFHVGILRAGQDFRSSSRLSILEALLTLALGSMATWCWGVYGLYASTIGVLVGSWIYVKACGVRRLQWDWHGREIGRLIGIGSPILAGGVLLTFFRSVDKLMILACEPDREFQLGCYSLALLVSGQLYSVGNALSIVVGPRYAAMYGALACRRRVARFAAQTSQFQAAVLAWLGGVAIVAAPAVLGAAFPSYSSGLAPLGWVVIAGIALGLSLPASQYLTAVGMERRAFVAMIPPTLFSTLGNYLALKHGGQLRDVAAITALGQAGYALTVMLLAFWPQLSPAERWRSAIQHLLALVPAVSVAWFAEDYWPTAHTGMLIVLWKLFLVTSASALGSWAAWRINGAQLSQPAEAAA
jgi:O-antigen/teichoic acid export membrane protein